VLLEGGGTPAVLSLATFAYQPGSWGAADITTAVAAHYGLAVAHYRDAVWPVADEEPAHLRSAFWKAGGDGQHPDKITHEFVADVVKYALLALHARRLPPAAAAECPRRAPPARPATSFANVAVSCVSRPGGALSAYSAKEHFAAGSAGGGALAPVPQPRDGGWRLFEDRPRKPGWIASGAAPANLTFRLRVSSASPRIEVSFLRSYHGVEESGCSNWNGTRPWMGAARVVVTTAGGCASAHYIDSRFVSRPGLYPLCASVASLAHIGAVSLTPAAAEEQQQKLAGPQRRRLELFQHTVDAGAFTCPIAAGGDTVEVRFEAGGEYLPGKFKALAVASC